MRGRTTVLIAFLLSATLGGYFAGPLLVPNGDRRSMLPGPTSRGHQAFESACERCHTPFGGVTNQACLQCHGHQLTASEDSHPESKFTDPRNAERTASLDARTCVTCHREHAPARTRAGGVTLPRDLCAACHRNIAKERPSHAGFGFESCASTGWRRGRRPPPRGSPRRRDHRA